MNLLRPRHGRSIRARFVLAFGVLVALAVVNIAAFYRGTRQREVVFSRLRQAIARHTALIETKAGLEDHAKRVRVVSDLFGVEEAVLSVEERTRTIGSIDAIRRRLTAFEPTGTASDTVLVRVRAETDSLTDSWKTFYQTQRADPAQAISELVLVAEPLGRRLLGTDFPVAIQHQNQEVQLASAAFVEADRASSRLAWGILLVSGVLSGLFVFSLSRDLVRAITTLKTGVDKLGSGDLAHAVLVENCAELEAVGQSLNVMAERVRHARDELQLRNDELAHLAFRDPLTNLANRALFRDRVIEAMSARGRRPEEIAVLFIDLDNFKGINDTLGHDAGDRLLIEVASRLLNATRGADTVARLGGDEFAMLLHRVRDTSEALIVADRVIEAMKSPFALDERPVHITASIGIACGQVEQTVDELLRNADVAMYRAKSHGKSRFEVFAPEMHASLVEHLELIEELRGAHERGEIGVLFQPIVDLSSNRVVGFEALARWHNPRRGLVSPGVFIPIAEETGAIIAIGRCVLFEACRQATAWQTLSGDPAIAVSVNVSGCQLDAPSFVADVSNALSATGLEPSCLLLEMTETVIMRDSTASLTRLQNLKALGVRLAVDDFGTGYSSLAYLQRFPVDILKIDKAFVDEVARGGNDAALARTIIALGETLKLRTVAEGIETPDQLSQLRLLGCPLGQGYFFARPLGSADATAFLLASRSDLDSTRAA